MSQEPPQSEVTNRRLWGFEGNLESAGITNRQFGTEE
jgi:hypothetical protein